MGIEHTTQFTPGDPKLNAAKWNEAHAIDDDTITAAHLVDTYTKSTVGQTITVSTAAELTTTLTDLSDSPNMLGDIYIFYDADIVGNFTVPDLLTNGHKLVLCNTLSELLTDVATGGAATVAGTSKGYVEDTGAAWVINAYRGKLLMNPSGHYTSIESNTSTRIYYAAETGSFTAFSGGETITVYDVQHSITGNTAFVPTITVANKTILEFDACKIINNGHLAPAIRIGAHAQATCRKAILSTNDSVFGAVHIMTSAELNSLGSVYIGKNNCIRLEATTSYYYSRDDGNIEKIGGDTLLLSSSPSGNKAGLYGAGGALCFDTCISSIDSRPVGSRGISLTDNAAMIPVFCFVDGFETGAYAAHGAKIRNAATVYTDYTTLHSPTGAADPSYIV